MMTKIDQIIAQLGPRDTLTLKGKCRLNTREKKITGKDLLAEGTISCDEYLGRPRHADQNWTARFERAKAVRRHDATSIEVEVFAVTATRDTEQEELLRTVLISG